MHSTTTPDMHSIYKSLCYFESKFGKQEVTLIFTNFNPNFDAFKLFQFFFVCKIPKIMWNPIRTLFTRKTNPLVFVKTNIRKIFAFFRWIILGEFRWNLHNFFLFVLGKFSSFRWFLWRIFLLPDFLICSDMLRSIL